MYKKHKVIVSLLMVIQITAAMLLLDGCGPQTSESQTLQDAEKITEESKDMNVDNSEMHMRIGDTPVEVKWEDNESVAALRELVSQDTLSIDMSMYGGFEQVGSIGSSLPRNDIQTTTGSGDIVLYSGDQIVVFYGSNSWAYTRLGKIVLSEKEMKDILGNGDVTITISME